MMASISVPCPKCSLPGRPSGPATPPSLVPLRSLPCQVPNERRYISLKAQAHEAVLESTNSTPKSSTKLELPLPDAEQEDTTSSDISDSRIKAVMAEVSELVKLVDSRDIVELQLKQIDCEIVIRKKEALPQPAAAPVVMSQVPPQAYYSPQPPSPAPPCSPDVASKSATPTTLPSPPKANDSSLPPLKSPMAGTFYRSPSPGEPPFVKVGDKVQKGQILCIIEAMKLMNEIEADKSGTVVDILVENAKPVTIGTPLFIIQP